MEKVYVVKGVHINFVGVFTDKTEAEEVAEKINYGEGCCGSNERVHVVEVVINDRKGW